MDRAVYKAQDTWESHTVLAGPGLSIAAPRPSESFKLEWICVITINSRLAFLFID